MHTPPADPAQPADSSLDYMAAPPPAMPLEAVAEPERIAALDVARGFALLGILLVNMDFFSRPFGELFTETRPQAGARAIDVAAYYFVTIFCEGKFYPLFSMLFGAGFMIMLGRARAAGRAFVPVYLRRLGVLAVLGLAHGLLLWYGDILFMYSVAGLLLFAFAMIFARAGPRAYLTTGAAMVLIATLFTGGITALTAGGGPGAARPATQPTTLPATQAATQTVTSVSTPDASADTPVERLFRGFREQTIQSPDSPGWVDAETEAYREGPYLQATAFRAFGFFSFLAIALFGFGWHVVGMVFIGAGLMRAGMFEVNRARWWRTALLVGALVGVPLAAAGALAPRFVEGGMAFALMMGLTMLGGPLVSLGYLGAVVLIVAANLLTAVTASLARVGRMALTNYLVETMAATFLMYHWGLGWFGTTTPAGRIGIALTIYAALHVTSTLWLSAFAMGPMEWLWRTLTYLRPQRLRRRQAGA